MFKIKALIGFIVGVSSQKLDLVGDGSNQNCVLDGGYTWCESSQSCIRVWETPCSDNFLNCDDCLSKQRSGINIACPSNCDMIAIDPMPVIDPIPLPPPPSQIRPTCPPVCMIYCENGNQLDENGCPTCNCNEELPPPVTDQDCILNQPLCDDYTFVCPKLTEITNCNEGGIDGYTTFQLSLIIKDTSNVKNIYAIYGDEEDELYLPPAYQSPLKLGDNIGGVNPMIIRINPESEFDSWLTLGITDGNSANIVSSIGIDFDSWTSTNGISINNGAVFGLDPDENIIYGNEYIIGQLTVLTGTNYEVIVNVQGKWIDDSLHRERSWIENNIRFRLDSPQNIDFDRVPENCIRWYDGCNTCEVVNGVIGGCTRMMCFREESPRCLTYNSGH